MKNQILKIRNKILEREAFQWTGDNEIFVRRFVDDDSKIHMVGNGLEIWNEESKDWLNIPVNHYLVKGLKGEFYPISPEVFERSFEILE